MPLRILTINLYNGRAQSDSLEQALRRYRPDVVAAQELSANGAEVLACWASNHLLDPRDDTTGMGFATNRDVTFSRPSFPNRIPIIGKIDASDDGFRDGVEVINAHLVNPIARPARVSRDLRRREVAALTGLLRARMASTTRLLVGDLNSSPAWPLYRRLAAVAEDAAVMAGTAKRTWGYWPRSPRLLRIDHCFVQNAKAIETQLVNIRGADHRGLLIDVEPVR